jgi:hypothetical protein
MRRLLGFVGVWLALGGVAEAAPSYPNDDCRGGYAGEEWRCGGHFTATEERKRWVYKGRDATALAYRLWVGDYANNLIDFGWEDGCVDRYRYENLRVAVRWCNYRPLSVSYWTVEGRTNFTLGFFLG